MWLLAFAAMLGLALLVARGLPARPGAAVFVAASAVVVASYTAALAGLLAIASTAILWLGVGALLWRAAVDAKRTLSFVTSPAVLVFVAGGVVHAWLFAEAEYRFFDEYAQWGLLTREVRRQLDRRGPGSPRMGYPATSGLRSTQTSAIGLGSRWPFLQLRGLCRLAGRLWRAAGRHFRQ